VKRRTEKASRSGLNSIGLVPEALTSSLEHLVEYMPLTPPSAILSVTETSTIGTPSAAFIPAEKSPRPANERTRLFKRRVVPKPWLAPSLPSGNLPTTLAEKNRKFESTKAKDLWDVFYGFRVDFPRPVESSAELKRLCLSWEMKYKGSSTRVLPRFFKKHPELAVWAIWAERAIHETKVRSGTNQFPQINLLRDCLRILVDAQTRRLRQPKRA
jgi:hypothetical protein